MKNILSLLALIALSNTLLIGQTTMNIYQSNGTILQIPLSSIDSITYSISGGGGTTTGTTLHTCGAPNIHNPDLTYGTMTDQEGNVYKTIVIGTQEWMAENLNTSIYRNGDAIPTNLDDAAWQNTTSGAWAYYNNDASYACPYGKLYNWYTCVDARQLCPVGWHVPSDVEWNTLLYHLDPNAGFDDNNNAGGKIKSVSTQNWLSPNVDATNESGFSGLPSGLRAYVSSNDLGYFSYWWSSSLSTNYYSWCRELSTFGGNVRRYDQDKKVGLSVRCLRN